MLANSSLGFGIIGFGYMGKWHFKKLKDCKIPVVSVCDTDQKQLDIAAGYGLKTYSMVEEFLRDGNISNVIIATPNDSHYHLIELCINHGVNIICEKPVVLDYSSLKRVEKLLRGKDIIFTVHKNRRWDSDFVAIKEAVQNRLAGNPVHIESRIQGQRGVMYGWRGMKKFGGGLLLDWGPHLIDQILQIFPTQRVVNLYSDCRTIQSKDVDDCFRVTLFFDNNVTCYIEASLLAFEKLPRWYASCHKGTLLIQDMGSNKVDIKRIVKSISPKTTATYEVKVGSASRLLQPLGANEIKILEYTAEIGNQAEFYYDFLKCVEEKGEPLVTFEDIARTVRIIDLIKESSEKKSSIKCYV